MESWRCGDPAFLPGAWMCPRRPTEPSETEGIARVQPALPAVHTVEKLAVSLSWRTCVSFGRIWQETLLVSC